MAEEKELTEEERRAQGERAAREGNEKRNNDRLDRLNAIANQSDELKTEDGLEDIPDEAWQEPRQSKAEKDIKLLDRMAEENSGAIKEAEKEDEAQDEARELGATDIKVVNGETYYQQIVNGTEKWMTLPQLRETASKVTAADEYLRNAKESAKRAQELIPSQEDEPADTRQARIRECITRVQMGDEGAAEELAQLIAGPSRVTPDVLKAVDERIGSQLSFRETADWFRGEYKAEWEDPVLNARIVKRDKEMAQLYPEMNYRERLKEVGDEARAIRIAKGEKPTLKLQSKEQRKAQVRALPTAAARLVDESDEGEDETYESAIAQIAKARGQGRPIIHKR